MYRSLAIALALLAAVPTSVVSVPTEVVARDSAAPLSNAQRLARGLPLLPAKFGRSIPGVTPAVAAPALRMLLSNRQIRFVS